MKDLDYAINHSHPLQVSVLKQAYTQRALLKRHFGDVEGAQRDFEQGASYGSELAQNIAVQGNVFAQMGNAIREEYVSSLLSKPL
jgi:hypothetical protein